MMVAAVALAAAFVPTAGNATACDGSPTADTLQMTVVAKKRHVTLGENIKLLVKVDRGIEGDEQLRVPASGIETTVVLNSSRPYMAGAATTDTDGIALVEIAVPKKAPLGWIDGVATAEHAPPVCGDAAAERGYWAGTDVVKIRR